MPRLCSYDGGGDDPPETRGATLDQRRNLDPRHIAPKRLEPVEIARRGCEDVDDNVEVVQKDPLALALALNPSWAVIWLQLEHDLLGDGFGLSRRRAGDDDEVVRIGNGAGHGENDDVLALLVGGERRDGDGQFSGPADVSVRCYGSSF